MRREMRAADVASIGDDPQALGELCLFGDRVVVAFKP
jgi:hypothetical protein